VKLQLRWTWHQSHLEARLPANHGLSKTHRNLATDKHRFFDFAVGLSFDLISINKFTLHMISTAYIGASNQRLDLELKIISHFLLHPHEKEARDAFVAKEKTDYDDGMKRFLKQKPDCDKIDDLLAPVIVRNYERWLATNLHHLKEFSENRLKQMELILRYTLFESFLLKIVGNILWEYPNLRSHPIHGEMQKRKLLRWKKSENQSQEQIAWTKAAVNAVDRLPFAKWKEEEVEKSPIYLWRYLCDGLDLEFGQEKLCSTLERARRMRNYIVHRSLELSVLNERMAEMKNHLAGFPILLAEAASKIYPKACTENVPEEDDDGTPTYVLLEEFL
jgi:hypothetical protein